MKFLKTDDGSYTLFSEEYNQSYHSQKDGALSESLYKHIDPSFMLLKERDELTILDICFGLGYNTLATLYYVDTHHLDVKLNIYSPELDGELIASLENFIYPKELILYKEIITNLITKKSYQSEKFNIHLFVGDAREYIKNLDIKFDIVYQDAFSSDVNYALWTKEYFGDICTLLREDGIITTYSIATPVRLSMYENNLKIYEYQSNVKKRSTIASKQKLNNINLKYIDMEKKKRNNPNAKALVDDFREIES